MEALRGRKGRKKLILPPIRSQEPRQGSALRFATFGSPCSFSLVQHLCVTFEQNIRTMSSSQLRCVVLAAALGVVAAYSNVAFMSYSAPAFETSSASAVFGRSPYVSSIAGSSFLGSLRPRAGRARVLRSSARANGATTIKCEADYYADLGIGRSANDKEIKSAFRQKARKLHPDVNPDPDAQAQFQKIQQVR